MFATAAGMASARSYTLGQILLHWSIAALVIWQLVIGESMEAFEHPAGADPTELLLANSHIWAGFAILGLVAIRIILRLAYGAPPPEEPNRATAVLARLAHTAFYVLLVVVPVTGILDFYFQLPTGGIHQLGKPAFIVLIALHVAATAWHQFIRRDNTLRRMLVPSAR